jgi:hypothetical protein
MQRSHEAHPWLLDFRPNFLHNVCTMARSWLLNVGGKLRPAYSQHGCCEDQGARPCAKRRIDLEVFSGQTRTLFVTFLESLHLGLKVNPHGLVDRAPARRHHPAAAPPHALPHSLHAALPSVDLARPRRQTCVAVVHVSLQLGRASGTTGAMWRNRARMSRDMYHGSARG